jgi:hypothetical protein
LLGGGRQQAEAHGGGGFVGGLGLVERILEQIDAPSAVGAGAALAGELPEGSSAVRDAAADLAVVYSSTQAHDHVDVLTYR